MASEASGPSGLQIHPMDQFIPKQMFGEGELGMFTLSNSAFWMLLAVASVILIFVLGPRKKAIIPSRSQSIAEIIYQFGYKMVEDIAGKDGVRYFPLIMTLFLFILFVNLLGLIPMSFTATSHFIVTGIMALLVFVSVTILGFARNGLGYLKLFWVSDAPMALRPMLAAIELLAYFVRPLSHSVRLAGNILAGHAVLKVFAGFAGVMWSAYFLPAMLPIVAIALMYALEVLVAAVQAYVFAILTCVYLHDALHPGH